VNRGNPILPKLSRGKIFLYDLHDQIIDDIHFNWKKGTLEIELRSQVLQFSGVTDYQAQRKLPWGFSNSINEANISQSSEQIVLELEMQSGDKIIIHYTESNLIG
jgi:hypothetical protein